MGGERRDPTAVPSLGNPERVLHRLSRLLTADARIGSAMRYDLSGRVVAITGASSGIGEATALMCAEAGAAVALGARRADRIEALRGGSRPPAARAIARPDRHHRRGAGPRLRRERPRASSAGSTRWSTTRA